MTRLCIAVSCVLMAAPLQAQEASADEPCPGAATQRALDACADSAFRRADRMLNRRYQAVLASIDSTRRPLLRTAQRAWLALRDTQCRYEASIYDGGTAYPMAYAFCLAAMSTTREAQLREVAESSPR